MDRLSVVIAAQRLYEAGDLPQADPFHQSPPWPYPSLPGETLPQTEMRPRADMRFKMAMIGLL